MFSYSNSTLLFTEEYYDKLTKMKAAMDISDIAVYEAINDF